MHIHRSTIVAQASAVGRAGIGVIRLSGADSRSIALALCRSQNDEPCLSYPSLENLKPRYSHLTYWFTSDGTPIDQGLTIYFPSPHSFTGEDVVELQAHGGVVILDWLIERCIELGATMARPGEFSERSFLNGKLDLAQAEAVASLIDAQSRTAVVSAGRSLQGRFSDQIHALVEKVTELRVHVEAAIDFVDEDLETNDIEQIELGLKQLIVNLNQLTHSTECGIRLHEGIRIAIAGAPNAGKSSLMNALAQTDSAIVSDIPGTTRDIVKEQLVLRGLAVEVLDTAGLRETSDPIEAQGVTRAVKALQSADLLLWVFDANKEAVVDQTQSMSQLCGNQVDLSKSIMIANKADLLDQQKINHLIEFQSKDFPNLRVCSVQNHLGIEALIDLILEKVGLANVQEGQFIARRRHLEALNQSLSYLSHAYENVRTQPLELVAEELRLTQEALASVTGQFTSDDLLGKIFSSFCVGK